MPSPRFAHPGGALKPPRAPRGSASLNSIRRSALPPLLVGCLHLPSSASVSVRAATERNLSIAERGDGDATRRLPQERTVGAVSAARTGEKHQALSTSHPELKTRGAFALPNYVKELLRG